jgi:predicted methyltransferase
MSHGLKNTTLALAAGCLMVACVTQKGSHAVADSKLPQTDAATSAAIDKSLAGPQRSDANRARDVYRHPKQTLTFFGVRQDMTVVEIWPGPGGWYTEVLAPLLRDHGKLYAAQYAPDPTNPNVAKNVETYQKKLASDPSVFGKVTVTALGPESFDIAPPGSADMVLTFRNIHNWMRRDYAPKVFQAAYTALKPGGVLGVVEHRGNPAVPQDPQAKSGYVNEDVAIRMIEGVGFKLVDKSEINANPRDTKDYEKGVWTLPPVYTEGDRDREKYAAIGESDRMTLRFVKPK